MPRKSEMRLHNTARTRGNNVGKKIVHKIHTHCAQRFARLVPVYKKRKPRAVISLICTCELRLSY